MTFADSCRMGGESAVPDALDSLSQWCQESNMRLNPTKCKAMRVTFSKTHPQPLVLEINDTTLQEIRELKMLGVTIQCNLKWDSHVSNIVRRASRKLYIIRVMKRYRAPVEDLLTIFTCYVRPNVEYCVPVWHFSITAQQSTSIERIQKRALRLIYGDQYVTYKNALQLSKLETLYDRRDVLCLNYAKSLLTKFRDWLPELQSTHRSLRHSEKLRVPKCRTVRYRSSALPFFFVRLLNENGLCESGVFDGLELSQFITMYLL